MLPQRAASESRIRRLGTAIRRIGSSKESRTPPTTVRTEQVWERGDELTARQASVGRQPVIDGPPVQKFVQELENTTPKSVTAAKPSALIPDRLVIGVDDTFVVGIRRNIRSLHTVQGRLMQSESAFATYKDLHLETLRDCRALLHKTREYGSIPYSWIRYSSSQAFFESLRFLSDRYRGPLKSKKNFGTCFTTETVAWKTKRILRCCIFRNHVEKLVRMH